MENLNPSFIANNPADPPAPINPKTLSSTARKVAKVAVLVLVVIGALALILLSAHVFTPAILLGMGLTATSVQIFGISSLAVGGLGGLALFAIKTSRASIDFNNNKEQRSKNFESDEKKSVRSNEIELMAPKENQQWAEERRLKNEKIRKEKEIQEQRAKAEEKRIQAQRIEEAEEKRRADYLIFLLENDKIAAEQQLKDEADQKKIIEEARIANEQALEKLKPPDEATFALKDQRLAEMQAKKEEAFQLSLETTLKSLEALPNFTFDAEQDIALTAGFFGDSFASQTFLDNIRLEGGNSLKTKTFLRNKIQQEKEYYLKNNSQKEEQSQEIQNRISYYDHILNALDQAISVDQFAKKLESLPTNSQDSIPQAPHLFALWMQEKIKNMKNEDRFLMPGGWRGDPGHALLYEIVCKGDTFLFNVINSGAGLHYHSSAHIGSKEKFNNVFQLHCSKNDLMSPEVWKAHYKLNYTAPSSTPYNASDVYEKFLMSLNPIFSDKELSEFQSKLIENFSTGQRVGNCTAKVLFAYIKSYTPVKDPGFSSKAEYKKLKIDVRKRILEESINAYKAVGFFNESVSDPQKLSSKLAHLYFLQACIDKFSRSIGKALSQGSDKKKIQGEEGERKIVAEPLKENWISDTEAKELHELLKTSHELCTTCKEKIIDQLKNTHPDFYPQLIQNIQSKTNIEHFVKIEEERVKDQRYESGNIAKNLPTLSVDWKNPETVHLDLNKCLKSLQGHIDERSHISLRNIFSHLPVPSDEFWQKIPQDNVEICMQAVADLTEKFLIARTSLNFPSNIRVKDQLLMQKTLFAMKELAKRLPDISNCQTETFHLPFNPSPVSGHCFIIDPHMDQELDEVLLNVKTRTEQIGMFGDIPSTSNTMEYIDNDAFSWEKKKTIYRTIKREEISPSFMSFLGRSPALSSQLNSEKTFVWHYLLTHPEKLEKARELVREEAEKENKGIGKERNTPSIIPDHFCLAMAMAKPKGILPAGFIALRKLTQLSAFTYKIPLKKRLSPSTTFFTYSPEFNWQTQKAYVNIEMAQEINPRNDDVKEQFNHLERNNSVFSTAYRPMSDQGMARIYKQMFNFRSNTQNEIMLREFNLKESLYEEPITTKLTEEDYRDLLLLRSQDDQSQQIIKTVSYFSNHLSKISDPDFQHLFMTLFFEHGLLRKQLQSNRDFIPIFEAFIARGIEHSKIKEDISTEVFFLRMNDYFQSYVEHVFNKVRTNEKEMDEKEVKFNSSISQGDLGSSRSIIHALKKLLKDPTVNNDDHKKALVIRELLAAQNRRNIPLNSLQEIAETLGWLFYYTDHQVGAEIDLEDNITELKNKILLLFHDKNSKEINEIFFIATGRRGNWENRGAEWISKNPSMAINLSNGTFTAKDSYGRQVTLPRELNQDPNIQKLFKPSEEEILVRSSSKDKYLFIDRFGYENFIHKKENGPPTIERRINISAFFETLPDLKKFSHNSPIFKLQKAEANNDAFSSHCSCWGHSDICIYIDNRTGKIRYIQHALGITAVEDDGKSCGSYYLTQNNASSANLFLASVDPHVEFWKKRGELGNFEAELIQLPRYDTQFQIDKASQKVIYTKDPKYHLSSQSIPSLSRYTGYLVLEETTEEAVKKHRVLIPERAIHSRKEATFQDLSLPLAFDERDLGEKHSIYEYQVDAKGELNCADLPGKLYLAYLYLTKRDYHRSQKILKEISLHKKMSILSEKEVQLLTLIVTATDGKDQDFKACALRLKALALINDNKQKYQKNPDDSLFSLKQDNTSTPQSSITVQDIHMYLNQLSHAKSFHLDRKECMLLKDIASSESWNRHLAQINKSTEGVNLTSSSHRVKAAQTTIHQDSPWKLVRSINVNTFRLIRELPRSFLSLYEIARNGTAENKKELANSFSQVTEISPNTALVKILEKVLLFPSDSLQTDDIRLALPPLINETLYNKPENWVSPRSKNILNTLAIDIKGESLPKNFLNLYEIARDGGEEDKKRLSNFLLWVEKHSPNIALVKILEGVLLSPSDFPQTNEVRAAFKPPYSKKLFKLYSNIKDLERLYQEGKFLVRPNYGTPSQQYERQRQSLIQQFHYYKNDNLPHEIHDPWKDAIKKMMENLTSTLIKEAIAFPPLKTDALPPIKIIKAPPVTVHRFPLAPPSKVKEATPIRVLGHIASPSLFPSAYLFGESEAEKGEKTPLQESESKEKSANVSQNTSQTARLVFTQSLQDEARAEQTRLSNESSVPYFNNISTSSEEGEIKRTSGSAAALTPSNNILLAQVKEQEQKAKSQVEKVTFEKLFSDIQEYTTQAKPKAEKSINPEQLLRLKSDLEIKQKEAQGHTEQLKQQILKLANKAPLETSKGLRRFFNRELSSVRTPIEMEELFILIHNDDVNAIQKRNKALSTEDIQLLKANVEMFLVREIHLQQIKRGIDLVKILENKNLPPDVRHEQTQALINTLTARRCYNIPDKEVGEQHYFKYLLIEYQRNLILRSDQILALEKFFVDITNNPEKPINNKVLQIPMGAGKTDILMALLLLRKANGKQLSIAMLPEELKSMVSEKLQVSGAHIFQQGAHQIDWTRTNTVKDLRSIYNQLCDIITSRGFLVVSSTEMHNFILNARENRWNCTKKSPSQETLEKEEVFRAIKTLFKEQGNVIIDEIDMQNNCRKEVHKAVGDPIKIEKIYGDITAALFLELVNNPKVSRLFYLEGVNKKIPGAIPFSSNVREQYPKEYGEFEALIALAGINHLSLTYPLPEVQKKILIEYLTTSIGKGITLPLEIRSNQKLLDALGYIKGQIKIFSPLTLSKIKKQNFGLLPNSDGSFSVIPGPYDSQKPQIGSEFAHFGEQMNYTLLCYIDGIPPNLLQKELSRIFKKAENEIKLNPRLAISDTRAYKEFKNICGNIPVDSLLLKRIAEGTLKYEGLIDLTNQIAQQPELTINFTSKYIFPLIKLYPLRMSSNAQSQTGVFHTKQGFTGTLTSALHQDYSVETIESVDGKTASLLWNNSRSVTILPEMATESSDEIKAKIEAIGLPPKVKKTALEKSQERGLHYLRETFKDPDILQYRAIIDLGGLFQDTPSNMLAKEILTLRSDLNAVFYFDGDKPMTLKRNMRGIFTTLEGHSPEIKPEDRFTIYGQRQCTGTHIDQTATAKAFITLNKNSTLRDFLQASWRMRGLGKGQSLKTIIPDELSNIIKVSLERNREDEMNVLAPLLYMTKNQAKGQADDNLLVTRQELQDIVFQACDQYLDKVPVALLNSDPMVELDDLTFSLFTNSPFKQFGQTEVMIDAKECLIENMNQMLSPIARWFEKNAAWCKENADVPIFTLKSLETKMKALIDTVIEKKLLNEKLVTHLHEIDEKEAKEFENKTFSNVTVETGISVQVQQQQQVQQETQTQQRQELELKQKMDMAAEKAIKHSDWETENFFRFDYFKPVPPKAALNKTTSSLLRAVEALELRTTEKEATVFHKIFSPNLLVSLDLIRTNQDGQFFGVHQKPIDRILIVRQRSTGETKLILGDGGDTERFKKILEERKSPKKDKEVREKEEKECDVDICLFHMGHGIGVYEQVSQEKINNKMISEDPKIQLLLVQAKIIAGETYYNEEELALLKKLLSSEPKLTKDELTELEERIKTFIIKRPSTYKNYPNSVLADLFRELLTGGAAD